MEDIDGISLTVLVSHFEGAVKDLVAAQEKYRQASSELKRFCRALDERNATEAEGK